MSTCPIARDAMVEPNSSDTDLVGMARQNRQSFALLYERYADRLYRYALERTGSSTLADDIVGETMIQALSGLDRFDPDRGSFAGWIFTIAKRRILDHQRAHRRLWRVLTRLHSRRTPVDPLTSILQHDEAAQVRAALARLPLGDQELLLLRYSADLSGREIGDILGISDGAARVRLSRARQRLARELEDHHD